MPASPAPRHALPPRAAASRCRLALPPRAAAPPWHLLPVFYEDPACSVPQHAGMCEERFLISFFINKILRRLRLP